MRPYTVYLAGPMENVDESTMCIWRQTAITLLEHADIRVLNPVRRRHSGQQRHMRRIFELDLADIAASNLVLVNLNHDSLAKHGTAMEVFHANYHLGKPVVAFKQELTRYHPFFESVVTEWRSTVEKACMTIIEEYAI